MELEKQFKYNGKFGMKLKLKTPKIQDVINSFKMPKGLFWSSRLCFKFLTLFIYKFLVNILHKITILI